MTVKKRIIVCGAALLPLLVIVLAILVWPDAAKFEGKELSNWCRALTSNNAQSREEAAAAFRRMDDSVVPELTRLLTVKDPGIRMTVWARARDLPQSIRTFLLRRVPPPDASKVRLGAAWGLGLMGPQALPAVPALTQALENPDFTFALQAAVALAHLAPETIPILNATLKDENPQKRQLAAFALAQTGPGAGAALINLVELLNDASPNVRLKARDAILDLGIPGLPATTGILREGTDAEKLQAATAVLNMQNSLRLVIPSLLRLTKSDSAELRAVAVRTLGVMRASQPSVLFAIESRLKDTQPAVRQEAVRALSVCSQDRAYVLKHIASALSDSSAHVSRTALEVLSELGPVAAGLRPQIETLSHSPDPILAQAAQTAMKNLERP